jgi:hypothetical protein
MSEQIPAFLWLLVIFGGPVVLGLLFALVRWRRSRRARQAGDRVTERLYENDGFVEPRRD